jgi:hypothetical protein
VIVALAVTDPSSESAEVTARASETMDEELAGVVH